MSYCPYCGRQLSDDMSYCPGCGAAVNVSSVLSYSVNDNTLNVDSGDYKIYITGLGSASKAVVIDLLEDVLGYTTNSAENLVRNIPVQIAGNLSLKQAAVIAQAFEEYGVELSVANHDSYEDISAHTSSSSIFNSDGSFLMSAAMILATLSAANRLRMIVHPKKPSLLERLFHSLFNNRKRPPVHVRRTIRPRNYSFPMYEPNPRKNIIRQQLRPSNYKLGNNMLGNRQPLNQSGHMKKQKPTNKQMDHKQPAGRKGR